MIISYRWVSLAFAILCAALALTLVGLPDVVFWLFQIEATSSAAFISRRAAMLFVGLALIAYFGRQAIHSDLRQGICLAMTVMLCAIAGLGLWEWARGYAGAGIFVAVITELMFAVVYLSIWRSHRQ